MEPTADPAVAANGGDRPRRPGPRFEQRHPLGNRPGGTGADAEPASHAVGIEKPAAEGRLDDGAKAAVDETVGGHPHHLAAHPHAAAAENALVRIEIDDRMPPVDPVLRRLAEKVRDVDAVLGGVTPQVAVEERGAAALEAAVGLQLEVGRAVTLLHLDKRQNPFLRRQHRHLAAGMPVPVRKILGLHLAKGILLAHELPRLRLGLSLDQVGVDGMGRLAPRRDRLDGRGGAGDHVASREDTVDAGLKRLIIDLNGLPAGEVQSLTERQEVGDVAVDQSLHLGVLPDGGNHPIAFDTELASLDRLRAAPAAGVGLAQLHAETLERLDPAPLLDHPHWRDEEIHLHPFVFRLHDLHLVRGHFGPGPPVEKPDLAGVEAECRARAVDGGVAAAHHQHTPRQRLGPVQTVFAQELDPGDDPLGLFILYPHLGAFPGADAEEHGGVTLFLEPRHGEVTPEGHIGVELHAQVEDLVDLEVERLLRQTVLGDAIAEHPARLGQTLKHVHVVPLDGEEVGTGEPRRAGPDDGDPAAVGLGQGRPPGLGPAKVKIGDVALDVVDADRFVHQVAPAPGDFAGTGADAAADRGQRVTVFDQADGVLVLPQRRQGDVALDIDPRRARQLAGADAVGEMIAQHQLQRGLPRAPNLRGLGLHHHAGRHPGGTGREKGPGPLHFYHADETGGERLQLPVMAQGGDALDAVLPRDLEDRVPAVGNDPLAVYFQFDQIHGFLTPVSCGRWRGTYRSCSTRRTGCTSRGRSGASASSRP